MKNDGVKIEMERRDKKKTKKKRNSSIASSIKSILRHADTFDKSLMVLGFLGAIGDGMSTPLLLLLFKRLMNDVGNSGSSDPHLFFHAINKVLHLHTTPIVYNRIPNNEITDVGNFLLKYDRMLCIWPVYHVGCSWLLS